MRRRELLAATGVAAAAGCLAELRGSETDSGFSATLRFPDHLLSLDHQGADVAIPGVVTDFADVPDRAGEALEAVIDAGTYETDDPEPALLEGVLGVQTVNGLGVHHYVKYEGTVYDVDHTLPVYVVSGREVPESEIDPDRTVSLVDERILGSDVDNGEVDSAIPTVVEGRDDPHERNHEYRAPVLEENLETFLERYEYVVYPGDEEDDLEPKWYVELELDREDPGPPYAVTAEEVPTERRYGRSVTEVSAYSDAAATALRRAAERPSTTPHPIDDRPAGIDAVLEDDAYVRIDDDVYEPALETVDHDAVPVSLEVTAVDEDEHAFTIAIEADGQPAAITAWPPAPLGVLVASPASDPDERDRESDREREREGESAGGRLRPSSGPSNPANDTPDTTRLEPGEPVTETYAVPVDEPSFGPGEYRVEPLPVPPTVEWGGDLDERDGAAESSPYPFAVSLSVPDRE